MNKPENYAAFYGLLNRMQSSDKEELKKSIVLQYTFGRTDSLREMNMREYNAALKGMKSSVPQDCQDILRARRSEVLLQMQRMGIDTADWDIINSFCADSRIAGKPFGKITVDELRVLFVKLRAMQRKRQYKSSIAVYKNNL